MPPGGTPGSVAHLSSAEEQRVPDWVKHAIWWQIYPLGFTSAEATGEPEPEAAGEPDGDDGGRPVTHRLGQLTGWLDYAVNLGASGVALGPVFAAQTHGYDTTDHYRIDSRLGDEQDFAGLVEAAHARGLRLLLDGVFNHVGRGFPAFQRVLEQGPDSPEASWFRLTWPADWAPGMEPEYGMFEGHEALVALNHEEPAVAGYVAGVMNHWLDAGADGWRLDAAYAVPTAFWAQVVPRVRARHPRAYLVGEVIHGDYPEFVAASGLDSVTQYELWKAIWSGLNDHNLFELGHALGRHNGFLETFAPLTFVGNHDVTRLASQLADDRHLAHALAVLLTVGGTPAIYYGDEQAFRGIKEERAGGDDEIRPGFPGGPDELAPTGWPIYRLHQDLIGLRRRHPWLHRAQTEMLHLASEQMIYRVAAGEQCLVVALSLADDEVRHEVPGARQILAGPGTLAGAAGPEARVILPAHGWAILS
jgi:cyclomaltodextrinase / maltogenic alpha-amylase / neopullulanase